MKKFIITIDTEGDNLWAWKPGQPITTENTRYLPRFQALCDEFGFQPVWLTNYEMISDPRYAEFVTQVHESGRGELGMHLHAWNNPPEHSLPVVGSGAPYLIEYPEAAMEAKIMFLHRRLQEVTGITPVSHRAGRWAMDQRYFSLLAKAGYRVDCSVTPKISWASSEGQSAGAVGSDYTAFPDKPYWVDTADGKLLEVPVTIETSHRFFLPEKRGIKQLAGAAYRAMKGQKLWVRPTGGNLKQMCYLADRTWDSDADYLMFMLHSSELMPGGSPTFRSEADIEKLYADMRRLFARVCRKYRGMTLMAYEAQQ